jgi:membrane-associated protease RseP (regulator of RpoE activity)
MSPTTFVSPQIKGPAIEVGEETAPRAGLTRQHLLQVVLLFATFLTTTLIGMRYMYDFNQGNSPLTTDTDILPYQWAWDHLGSFADGLPFSFTLLSILLAHEFGHYFACRFYGVKATLPFVFPAPTLSGTFGAVIRIKSRIQSRVALIVIGAAGPIAGFIVAIGTTCYGLIHSRALDADSPASIIQVGRLGIMSLLRWLLIGSNPDIPPLVQMVPHPVLVASWIGLLITAINLIPAGQLDGGHILYALSPRVHKVMSHVMIGVLLYLGTTEWMGWLFWAFLLMLPAMRHPRIFDEEPLGIGPMLLAPVALVIFVLTASTQPNAGMSLLQVLLRIHWGLWLR